MLWLGKKGQKICIVALQCSKLKSHKSASTAEPCKRSSSSRSLLMLRPWWLACPRLLLCTGHQVWSHSLLPHMLHLPSTSTFSYWYWYQYWLWFGYWYRYQLDMIKICDNMLYLPPTSNIIFILFLPEGFPPHLESVLNVNGAFSSRSPLQMMAKLLHPCRIIGYNVSSMPTVYHFKRPIQQQWRSWYLGEAKNDSVEVRIVNDFFNSNHDHIFKGVNFSNFPHMMTLLCTYLMECNLQNVADGT